MIVKMNGEELMTESSVPWWDLSGQAQEHAKEFFTDVIVGFLEALVDVIVDLSYATALIGGGILLILKVTTGSRRMGKWFACLMVVHFLIQLILG